MTSVYTFRSTNTNASSLHGLQQNNSPSSSNSGSVEIPKLDFNEINFPKLGSAKSSNSNELASRVESAPQPTCWGNKAIMETVKVPFPVQPVAPRNMIPPLFNKVKKNKQQTYEEEESDSEDEYDDYEPYEEEASESDDDF
jgi:hypothetical protein